MSYSNIGLLFLFICSFAVVFVIVSGQSTTDDNSGNSIMDQLINTVANLQTQVTKLVTKNNMLEAKVTKLEAQESTKSKSVCILFDAVCIYDVQQRFYSQRYAKARSLLSADVCLSVRLSVRPSDTFEYFIQTAQTSFSVR